MSPLNITITGTQNAQNEVDGKEETSACSPWISNTSTLVESGSDVSIPHDLFEGRQFYDPNATWTMAEESKVKRKTDIRLLGWICVMDIAMQLDKSNLANALTDNFLNDLAFTMTEYNNGIMIQRICVLVGQFPGQLLALRFGCRFVLPTLMIACGTVSWAQAWIHGRAGFYIARALIGLFEGAFAPCIVPCLSNFYKNSEMTFRLAILGSSLSTSRALSSLIAAYILTMRGVAGKPGWFYLFLLYGLVTFLIGLVSLVYLPAGPTKTRTVLWRKSWYTEKEQVIMVNRILRDDISKGRTPTRTLANPRDIWNTLKDPAMIGLWAIGLLGFIPKGPVHQYLALSLRHLGFSTFKSNILMMPSDFLRVFSYLTMAWSSEHFNDRAFHCILVELYCVPLLATLLALHPEGYRWIRFTIATLIIGGPNSFPIVVNWISRNSFDVKKRALSIVIFGVFDLIGSAASAHVYQKDDKPYFYRGNKILISICSSSVLILLVHREVLRRINRNKAKVWERMSESEQKEYRKDQENKVGNKSLTFAFSY